MTSDLKISGTRSSRPEVFCKKGVLGNFAKLTEKHLCQSLLFNKVTGPRPEVEISKDTYSCRIPLMAASPCCSDIVILRIDNKAHVCLSFLIICKELNFWQPVCIYAKSKKIWPTFVTHTTWLLQCWFFFSTSDLGASHCHFTYTAYYMYNNYSMNITCTIFG